MKNFYIISLATLLCAASFPASTDAQRRIDIDPEKPAMVIYAVGSNSNRGVYTLTTSGTATKISGDTYVQYDFGNSGGTFVSKDVVYGTQYNYGSYYAVKATSEGTSDGAWCHTYYDYRDASLTPYTWEIAAYDMTVDPVSGTIYGSFKGDQSGYSSRLCIYDGDNVKVTPVGSTTSTIITAIACDSKGQLWGISGYTGELYKIDKKSGEMEKVGSLGVYNMYGANQSAAIDPDSGKLYWGAANSFSAFMYEVDLEAVTATQLFIFPTGQRFNAFYIPGPDAPKTAPGSVENLVAEYTGEGTDVKISFTAPTVTAGGDELTDEISYTIEIDGTTADSGKVTAGNEVSSTQTLSEGSHSVVVYCENADGAGPKSSTTVYAGYDIPGSVSNLALAVEENNVTVTWDAPIGKNDGSVDMSKVTYTVTRNPGAVEIATGLTETTVTDVIPDGPIAEYSYVVTVNYDGEAGESLESETIMVGKPYTIPYTQNFDSAESLAEIGFKYVNKDASTNTWELVEEEGNKFVRITAASSAKREDYLYVAPIEFKSGEYKLKFKIANSCGDYQTLNMRIALSSSANGSVYDFKYYPAEYANGNFNLTSTADTKDKFVEYEMTFNVEEDGLYFLTFLDQSYYWITSPISIDDIEITNNVGDLTPAAVTELTATADGNSKRDITLSFTTPSVTVEGEALESIDKIEVYRGEELISTITEELETGKLMTYVDETAPRGELSYSVIAYSNELASETAAVEAYSGCRNNLAITGVTAPEKVPYSGAAALDVTVFNDANETAEGYTIVLVCNGTDVASFDGTSLEPDADEKYSFILEWKEFEDNQATYSVRIDYESDENPENNQSEEYTVKYELDSGIASAEYDSVKVSASNGVLTVTGAAGLDIAVHSVTGQAISLSRHHGTTYTLSLTSGVYVVTVGNHSYKIIL